jgi:hypothetical protein
VENCPQIHRSFSDLKGPEKGLENRADAIVAASPV